MARNRLVYLIARSLIAFGPLHDWGFRQPISLIVAASAFTPLAIRQSLSASAIWQYTPRFTRPTLLSTTRCFPPDIPHVLQPCTSHKPEKQTQMRRIVLVREEDAMVQVVGWTGNEMIPEGLRWWRYPSAWDCPVMPSTCRGHSYETIHSFTPAPNIASLGSETIEFMINIPRE